MKTRKPAVIKPDFSTIGDFFRSARKARGFDQLTAAKLTGLSRQQISNLERGLACLPPKHLKLVAKHFKLDALELSGKACDDLVRNYYRKAGLL